MYCQKMYSGLLLTDTKAVFGLLGMTLAKNFFLFFQVTEFDAPIPVPIVISIF